MTSNTPKFWYKPSSIFAKFLAFIFSPIAYIYRTGDKINRSMEVTKSVKLPVVCIGNLNIGGAGKTPTCIALSKIVKGENDFIEPVFLTRGYGGNVLGPEFVDTSNSSTIWGDEPLLLNQHARTIVSQNRYHGAELASHSTADIIIMDDGLQNNSLKKDVSIVVVDGSYGFGNQKTIPAGPLREPLEKGIRHADAFIIMGEDHYGVRNLIPEGVPAFSAKVKVKSGWKANKKTEYLAFCGIAHPPKFEKSLHDKGLTVKKLVSFPDHHAYTEKDISKLEKTAAKMNATLITTEKDFVRLPVSTQKENIHTLPIEAYFTAKEKKALLNFIKQTISANKGPSR